MHTAETWNKTSDVKNKLLPQAPFKKIKVHVLEEWKHAPLLSYPILSNTHGFDTITVYLHEEKWTALFCVERLEKLLTLSINYILILILVI